MKQNTIKNQSYQAPTSETKLTRSAVMAEDAMGMAMDKISGKWKLWILYVLRHGEEMRFSEIKRGIIGINDVMLSQSLKNLSECGLTLRKETGTAPVRVTYSLTPIGRGIVPALVQLEKWGNSLQ